MSSTADVGDAIELTFYGAVGATVTATWIDPAGVTVLDQAIVEEVPAGSGLYPYSFLVSTPGVWTAQFYSTGTAQAIERFYIRGLSITGPAPLATLGEVADLYGSLSTAQEDLVQALLRRASAMIRQKYTDIDQRIRDGVLDGTIAAHAVVNMVLRVLRNPGGLRSETVGPFSRTFDVGRAAGLLEITAAEADMLSPDAAATAVAGTIMVRAGLAPAPDGLRHYREDDWGRVRFR
jgi:hypothetical protein